MELDRRPVASLWIGEKLQYLNQLCLVSHLRHGHPVTLYCTDTVTNVPEGIEVRPANQRSWTFPWTQSSAEPRLLPGQMCL